MAPPFPDFASLELMHRALVDAALHNIGPYSDLSFVSLWCWNKAGTTSLSCLRGNLVARLQDYTTAHTCLTVAGINCMDETILDLLDYAEARAGWSLRLVPEICIQVIGTDLQDMKIEVEEDHADYLYDLATLAALYGQVYRSKRNVCHRIERAYSPVLRQVAGDDPLFQHEALRLAERWHQGRSEHGHDPCAADLAAIERCFHPTVAARLTPFRLTIDGRLVAFAINERLPGGVCLGHFLKADPEYPGIADFLLHEVADAHLRLGDRLLNTEQDLGLPGLRQWKRSWRPCGYLRKYRIARKTP